MKKRNKKYTPKPIVPMLMFGYDAAHALRLKMMPHAAFERLKDGVADDDDLATIVVRLDWGYILAKKIFEEPVISGVLEKAFEGVKSLQNTINTSGLCIATEHELGAIGKGLTVVDDLQDNTTRREQWLALHDVRRMCAT